MIGSQEVGAPGAISRVDDKAGLKVVCRSLVGSEGSRHEGTDGGGRCLVPSQGASWEERKCIGVVLWSAVFLDVMAAGVEV